MLFVLTKAQQESGCRCRIVPWQQITWLQCWQYDKYAMSGSAAQVHDMAHITFCRMLSGLKMLS